MQYVMWEIERASKEASHIAAESQIDKISSTFGK